MTPRLACRSLLLLGLCTGWGMLPALACKDGSSSTRARPATRDAASPAPDARPPAPAPPAPRRFTFFVTADTHAGAREIEPWNRKHVESMNQLPGTAYPKEYGGTVGAPLGVLIAGDLTDNGYPQQLAELRRVFGLDGKEGLLRYPVYAATGNHDRQDKSPFVARALAKQYGRLPYAWTWHGVRFLCLDTHPQAKDHRWIQDELKAAGPTQPVIIFFHYNLVGEYSYFWSRWEKQAFRKLLTGYNVVALFHGHLHPEEMYTWEGLDVFNVGSVRWYDLSYAVVEVTATQLQVVYWNWEHARWSLRFRKTLTHGPDPAALPPTAP